MFCSCCFMCFFWCCHLLRIIQYCNAEASWASFVTSKNSTNLRMLTELDTYFAPLYISKDVSETTARIYCSQACSKDKACHAFNFYGTESSFVCERQPDNFCRNQLTKIIKPQNGASLWDKTNNTSGISCLDRILSNGGTCEILRPGCLGTWPDCYNCTRTCIECQKRYSYSGYRNCTLWPDGDAPDSVPVFDECDGNAVMLVKRKFNKTEMILTRDYRMSFEDASRIFKLQQYSLLDFTYFGQYGYQYKTQYKISSLDADGTLRNLSLHVGVDLFYLNGLIRNTVPFVTVTDDIYNCGSFWLIDVKNATYCPGGYTVLFGKPVVDGVTIVSSGIHFSTDFYPTIVHVDAQVSLVP